MATSTKTEIILMIAENFGAQVSERIIYLWNNLMADYPDSICQKAALSLIRNVDCSQTAYNTMPPFAMMQRELDRLTMRIPESKERLKARAESAWDKMLDAAQEYGSYRVPDGLDVTTLYCIRSLGGWRVICSWRESELTWKKKDFLDLYCLADGKTDLLEAGPLAVDAFAKDNPEISSARAVADYMQSLQSRSGKKGLAV